jgi:arsenate reductase-like glutaredoxin family protein
MIEFMKVYVTVVDTVVINEQEIVETLVAENIGFEREIASIQATIELVQDTSLYRQNDVGIEARRIVLDKVILDYDLDIEYIGTESTSDNNDNTESNSKSIINSLMEKIRNLLSAIKRNLKKIWRKLVIIFYSSKDDMIELEENIRNLQDGSVLNISSNKALIENVKSLGFLIDDTGAVVMKYKTGDEYMSNGINSAIILGVVLVQSIYKEFDKDKYIALMQNVEGNKYFDAKSMYDITDLVIDNVPASSKLRTDINKFSSIVGMSIGITPSVLTISIIGKKRGSKKYSILDSRKTVNKNIIDIIDTTITKEELSTMANMVVTNNINYDIDDIISSTERSLKELDKTANELKSNNSPIAINELHTLTTFINNDINNSLKSILYINKTLYNVLNSLYKGLV